MPGIICSIMTTPIIAPFARNWLSVSAAHARNAKTIAMSTAVTVTMRLLRR